GPRLLDRRRAQLIEHPNTSPPKPSGPRYSARVALSCKRGHAPGQVLHALQELRQTIDDRLRTDLGGRYDRHSARSVGTDKLTVTFTLRAATDADAIRTAGLAAGTLAELPDRQRGCRGPLRRRARRSRSGTP